MSFYALYVYCPNLVQFDILVRHLNVMPFIIKRLMKIGEGKTSFLFWAYMGLHLRLYDEPVWYFEGKGHLGTTVRIPRICSYKKISCLDLYNQRFCKYR
jgi:hypothetical protein